jgi:hypothetical protein
LKFDEEDRQPAVLRAATVRERFDFRSLTVAALKGARK